MLARNFGGRVFSPGLLPLLGGVACTPQQHPISVLATGCVKKTFAGIVAKATTAGGGASLLH